jgi:hypothetical protein
MKNIFKGTIRFLKSTSKTNPQTTTSTQSFSNLVSTNCAQNHHKNLERRSSGTFSQDSRTFINLISILKGPALANLPLDKQEKIKKALSIKQQGNHVRPDECIIKNLEDGKKTSLYTIGLVFCTGLLMIGEKKVAMLHIYSEGEDFINRAFEEIKPIKIVILRKEALHTIDQNFEEYGLQIRALDNIDKLKNRAANSDQNCEIIERIYQEPSNIPIHKAALFYEGTKKGNHKIIDLSAKEMKTLNLLEHEKSKEESQAR